MLTLDVSMTLLLCCGVNSAQWPGPAQPERALSQRWWHGACLPWVHGHQPPAPRC